MQAPGDVGSLAFVMDGDVYVADWDGSDPVRIAGGRPGCEYSGAPPLWSPDGRYLGLFFSANAVVPVDGSTLHLTDRPIGRAAFSPDGSRVAYPGDRSLLVAEADGSHPRKVFDPEGPGSFVFHPLWSLIGDRIAFTSVTYDSADDSSRRSFHVGVVDVATGRVQMLAQAEGEDYVVPTDFLRDAIGSCSRGWRTTAPQDARMNRLTLHPRVSACGRASSKRVGS